MRHSFSAACADFIIRPLEREDIESLRLLRNQPHNRKWFVYDKEITKERQLEWFKKYCETDKDYMFSIFSVDTDLSKNNVFWGTVAIYKHSDEGYEVGRLLLDSQNIARRGMGAEVIKLVCSSISMWLKEEMPVLLYAEIFSDNERSLNCFRKNAFKEVGFREVNGRVLIRLERQFKNEKKNGNSSFKTKISCR